MFQPLTIGSLFSGIGGLELGLERAGLGPVVWQCEIDPFCRRVLARHWPDAGMLCDDIRTIKHPPPVDLICGGFPCQDISSAGKGAGLAGSRSGLWFEFARIIEASRPSWVVVENVASGARRWVDRVVCDLGRLGYEALPVPLSAADVGAPHLRRRVFIIAHTDSPKLREQPRGCGGQDGASAPLSEFSSGQGHAADARRQRRGRELQARQSQTENDHWWNTPPPVDAVVSRFPGRVDHQRALGNAVVPQCAEVIGHMINELRVG